MIGEYGSATCACSSNGERAAAAADGGLGGDKLVVAGAIQVSETLAGVAVSVGDGIGDVDAGILHLDDEQEISGGDCRPRAGGGSHGDGGCTGGHAGGAGIVSVQGSGETGCGRGLGNIRAGGRLDGCDRYVGIVAGVG